MGMSAGVYLLQGRDTDMRVDLSGVQSSVSEHRLDVANVRPAFEHVGGAGMAEEVAGAGFADPGLLHHPRYPVSEVGWTQTCAIA